MNITALTRRLRPSLRPRYRDRVATQPAPAIGVHKPVSTSSIAVQWYSSVTFAGPVMSYPDGGYNVYRSPHGTGTFTQIASGVARSPYLDTGLSAGSYDYKVTAVWGGLETAASPVGTGSTRTTGNTPAQFDKPLLTWDDFTFLGGFQCQYDPYGYQLQYGQNSMAVRRLAGATRFFMAGNQNNHSGDVFECNLPTLTTSFTPAQVQANNVLAQATILKDWAPGAIDIYGGYRFELGGAFAENNGFYFDSATNRLWFNYRANYSVNYTDAPNWGYIDVNDGAGTATCAGAWHVGAAAVSDKFHGGATAAVPSWFAAAFCPGQTMAVGGGGGYSGPAPSYGPVLSAIAPPTGPPANGVPTSEATVTDLPTYTAGLAFSGSGYSARDCDYTAGLATPCADGAPDAASALVLDTSEGPTGGGNFYPGGHDAYVGVPATFTFADNSTQTVTTTGYGGVNSYPAAALAAAGGSTTTIVLNAGDPFAPYNLVGSVFTVNGDTNNTRTCTAYDVPSRTATISGTWATSVGAGTPYSFYTGTNLFTFTPALTGGKAADHTTTVFLQLDEARSGGAGVGPAPVVGGVGSWTTIDFVNGAMCWIDGAVKQGVVFLPTLLAGWMAYTGAGQKTQGRRHELWVYDPADVAALMQGTSTPSQVQPYRANVQLPGISYPISWPTGVDLFQTQVSSITFDPVGKVLYIWINYYSLVLAYSVNC